MAWSVPHELDDAVNDVLGAERIPTVRKHRLELLLGDGRLECQERAQLCIAVLLDDDDRLVRIEKRADRGAEWEPANTHVVRCDVAAAEELDRLEHGELA